MIHQLQSCAGRDQHLLRHSMIGLEDINHCKLASGLSIDTITKLDVEPTIKIAVSAD